MTPASLPSGRRAHHAVYRSWQQAAGASDPLYWVVILALLESLHHLAWAMTICTLRSAAWPETMQVFRHQLGSGIFAILQIASVWLVILCAIQDRSSNPGQRRTLIYTAFLVLGLIIAGRAGFEFWLLNQLARPA